MQESEIILWNAIANDDDKAFEKLFALFYPPLCLYAKRYIEEKEIREDMVQDVFISLWERRKKLVINTSVRNYLALSVRNHCLNYLRKEGLNRQYREFVANEYTEIERHDISLLPELSALFDEAMARLPETYRRVFDMHQMEGKDYTEIAETLQISVRTAKRYKSQVVEKLKGDLKDYLPLIIGIWPNYF